MFWEAIVPSAIVKIQGIFMWKWFFIFCLKMISIGLDKKIKSKGKRLWLIVA